MKRNSLEFAIQCAVAHELDKLGLLWTSTANGLPSNPISVKNAKNAGLKPGVPDILVFEPRGQYHGLIIELKTSEGRPTAKQEEWVKALVERNYKAVICYGLNDTLDVVRRYLCLDH